MAHLLMAFGFCRAYFFLDAYRKQINSVGSVGTDPPGNVHSILIPLQSMQKLSMQLTCGKEAAIIFQPVFLLINSQTF